MPTEPAAGIPCGSRRSAISSARSIALAGLGALLGAGGWLARGAADPAPAAPPAPEPAPPAPAPAEVVLPPEQVVQTPIFPSGPPVALDAVPAGLANLSAQQCAACHGAVHDAWARGRLPGAWRADPYRQAVRDASSPAACLACHLPLVAQQPALVARYADGDMAGPMHVENPAWNATLQEEGVTCAACHVRDGRVLGPRPAEAAPHPVEESAVLRTSAACGPCHQRAFQGSDVAWYDTYGEWYRSRWREAGVRCQDCHMPQVAGPITVGRSVTVADHGFSVDPARAVSVLVELASPEIRRGRPFEFRVRVQNTGAGHAFPTGSPGRALRLTAGVVNDAGKPLHPPLLHRFGRTVTAQPPFQVTEDTRLPPQGEVTLAHSTTIPTSQRAGAAVLRVILTADGSDVPLVTRSVPVSLL